MSSPVLPVGPTPAKPPSVPPAAGLNLSADDFNAAFLRSLSDATPQAPGATPPAPSAHPVAGFWSRLLHSAKVFVGLGTMQENDQQDKDILGGVARGFVGATNNIGRSIFEGGAFLARHTGIGEAITPGYNAAYDQSGGARGLLQGEDLNVVTPQELDNAYGVRSDDPIANFAESTSQFVAGLALARGLGVKNFYAAGALADATAFDPYQAQLAELVARLPQGLPGSAEDNTRLVGELLSVHGDDNAFVARLKRATAGALSGALVDGLVAGVQFLRSSRVLADPAATVTQREAAQAMNDQSGEVLQLIADAQHTAAGDHVVVRPTPDGQFTLQVSPQSSAIDRAYPPDVAARVRQLDALANEARDLSLQANRTPAEEARLADLNQQMKTFSDVVPPLPQKPMAPVSTEVNPNDILARERARYPLTNASDLRFKDRGEAETQAAVMNDALDAHLQADQPITPAQLDQHFAFAKQLLDSKTPEDVARLAEGTHFNLSYASSPKDVLAQIEAISSQFRNAMDEAQGPIPVEKSVQIARDAIGGMTENDAPAILKGSLKDTRGLHARLLASDMVMKDLGQRLVRMSEVLDARPHDVVAHEEARTALENFYGLAQELAGANSEVGRSLRILQERANPAATAPLAFRNEGDAAASAAEDAGVAPEARPSYTAGMSHSEIRANARMVRMANGEPRNLHAVVQGARIMKTTGLSSKLFEAFVNGLLSGPRVAPTVALSGSALNMFEPVVRMAAGAATLNRQLLQEGADAMWGNFKYLGDNLRGTAAAFRAGHSIVDPIADHQAIGGLTGNIVRVPGKLVGAAHEFARLTGYRAFVRAKSLRLGREQGLVGPALEARVAEDLRSAFDPETGAATLPDALRYANTNTMATPLGAETLSGGFQQFLNNHVEAKLVVPFIRTPTNIFKYAFKSTPVLNLMSSEVRAALARGGEEAAIIHTRSALAGTLYAFGLYQALAGNLTGRGPSNPDMRALWLKNHQPYSVRVGGQWISYKRVEPLSMPLGLISDLSTVTQELGDRGSEGTDLAYPIVAALFYNLSSKSYMQGLTEFTNAWAANDPHATARWIQNFTGNALVPQGVQSLNPDSVYRDVQSVADAMISRIPGWSKTLLPRFNLFGEPELKTPGLVNRNQPFTAQPAGRSVEDDLLAVGKALAPMSSRIFGGLVDLKDAQAFDNGTHKAPYVRMMELLRRPVDGDPSLRQAMTDLVQSGEWKDASGGVTLFPGGKRWIMAASLKDKYESQALREVMDEYPRLASAIRQVQRLRGAAIQGGGNAVLDEQQSSGPSSIQSVQDMFRSLSSRSQ